MKVLKQYWWVLLLVAVVIFAVWFLNKENKEKGKPIGCKATEADWEAEVVAQTLAIKADSTWLGNVKLQVSDMAVPCGKLGLSEEECIAFNAEFMAEKKYGNACRQYYQSIVSGE